MDADERRALATVADYQFGAGAGAALFPPDEEPAVQRTRSGRPTQIHVDPRAAGGAGDGDSGVENPGGELADDDPVDEGSTADGAPRGRRLVSYGDDGRFRLGLAGGERLLAALPVPAYRVVVGDESEPFVRDGKNVFAKFVGRVGDEVRTGDEVAVVHEVGDLLAVGRAELSADEMRAFHAGMAVKVRDAAGDRSDGGAGA